MGLLIISYEQSYINFLWIISYSWIGNHAWKRNAVWSFIKVRYLAHWVICSAHDFKPRLRQYTKESPSRQFFSLLLLCFVITYISPSPLTVLRQRTNDEQTNERTNERTNGNSLLPSLLNFCTPWLTRCLLNSSSFFRLMIRYEWWRQR
jgi:hypothetical protein